MQADLSDRAAMLPHFDGIDVVVHSGALSSLWGRDADFEAANVVGTRHVIEGCRRGGVGRLVHISTPSLYHDGRSHRQISESFAPARPPNAYVRTKIAAEALVDAATAAGLWTATLRPRAIFGPGDRAVLPRIIRVLETGRLRVLGDGRNEVDVTYIDNAVEAVLLAGRAGGLAAGAKMNVTNGSPIPLWPFIDKLAWQLGLPRPRGHVPRRVIRAVAGVVEDFHKRFVPDREPMLTRYGVDVLTLTTTLDIRRARAQLGYAPVVGVEEGLERFVRHWLEGGR